jgi:hypothetical protein
LQWKTFQRSSFWKQNPSGFISGEGGAQARDRNEDALGAMENGQESLARRNAGTSLFREHDEIIRGNLWTLDENRIHEIVAIVQKESVKHLSFWSSLRRISQLHPRNIFDVAGQELAGPTAFGI